MKSVLLLLFLIGQSVSLFGQLTHLPRKLDASVYQDSVAAYYQRLDIPPNSIEVYETAFLIALNQYPELRDAHISFVFTGLRTTMAARPRLYALFQSREKRHYIILVNNKAAEKEAVSAEKLSFNARVGLIGHEIAHILDYSQKSSLRIIWDGLRYPFPKFKEPFEKATDKRAISHGFGWQVYDFADYVMNRSNAPKSYKLYKRKYYLEPHEIVKEMKFQEYPGLEQITPGNN